MTPIVPAIIPKSAAEVKALTERVCFSPELHLDVVDGVFVPFVSWPYEPVGVPAEVKVLTDPFTLEVDLMVSDATTAAAAWIEAGADMLVFHAEGITLEAFRQFVKNAPAAVSVGIAAINDTPLETLRPYIEIADSIQLMGIAKIGAQGQSFDERVIERLVTLKQEFPYHAITIDGSVNQDTIRRLADAGADRFICGSAIVSATDPEAAAQALQVLLN
jgi:ribulose-phosphate 3-epimerase